jgi:mRNA interferase HigB
MRVLSVKTLRDFWKNHADAADALKLWYKTVEKADWKKFADIRSVYRSADQLPNDRVVFDIKGNKYRIVAHIHYARQYVFIRFVGTHAEYDKIDAAKI